MTYLATNRGGGGLRFRREMDTSRTIFDLVDYVSNGFNTNKQTCVAAFINLVKAFDSIDHGILLKKLPLYGINGKI